MQATAKGWRSCPAAADPVCGAGSCRKDRSRGKYASFRPRWWGTSGTRRLVIPTARPTSPCRWSPA
jgi:hypothetical protein